LLSASNGVADGRAHLEFCNLSRKTPLQLLQKRGEIMRAKYFGLLMGLILVAGFSGCNSDGTPSGGAGPSNSETNQPPVPGDRSAPPSVSVPTYGNGETKGAPSNGVAKGSGSTVPPIGGTGSSTPPNGVSTADDDDISDSTGFGAQDSWGAYQEVHVQPFSVSADYFLPHDCSELQFDAKDQVKYGIWDDDYKGFPTYGRQLEIDFQDGELRTQNTASSKYHRLDKSKDYATLKVSLAYDNLPQEKKGGYLVSGIVTLVSGDVGYGGVNLGTGDRDPGADHSISMGYQNSSFYHHDCNPTCAVGGQFNMFGNGKSDGGRVLEVGLVSTDSDPMTVGKLRKAMGSLVKVVYPDQNTDATN
jgi:hypothetical protein